MDGGIGGEGPHHVFLLNAQPGMVNRTLVHSLKKKDTHQTGYNVLLLYSVVLVLLLSR